MMHGHIVDDADKDLYVTDTDGILMVVVLTVIVVVPGDPAQSVFYEVYSSLHQYGHETNTLLC